VDSKDLKRKKLNCSGGAGGVMDTTASLLLKKQLAELNKHPVEGMRDFCEK
jgi:hypothetical protein